MSKRVYLLLCMLPVILIALTAGAIVWFAQDHRQRDCLNYVSSHVVTDKAAWKRLVCHER